MADSPAHSVTPTADRDDLQEVTISVRAFPYYTDVKDLVSGKMVRREQVAVRGDTVSLDPDDYERAVRFNAIATGDSGEPPASRAGWDPNTMSLSDATVEDVSLWLQSEKPTVPQVVEEANSEPAYAKKLLDAENHATGQQPRSTLVEELEAIING